MCEDSKHCACMYHIYCHYVTVFSDICAVNVKSMSSALHNVYCDVFTAVECFPCLLAYHNAAVINSDIQKYALMDRLSLVEVVVRCWTFLPKTFVWTFLSIIIFNYILNKLLT